METLKDLVEETRFGVLLIGAPGVGKTTMCRALSAHMKDIGRQHCLINLDAANENVGYQCGVDVRDLITLEDAMSELQLGPNGGTLYCSEFLQTNFSWLQDQILAYQMKNRGCQYFVLDMPG